MNFFEEKLTIFNICQQNKTYNTVFYLLVLLQNTSEVADRLEYIQTLKVQVEIIKSSILLSKKLVKLAVHTASMLTPLSNSAAASTLNRKRPLESDPEDPEDLTSSPKIRQITGVNSNMENFSALTPKNGKNGLNTKSQESGGGGAKKLVIKNLKVQPTLPNNFQSKAVEKLKNAVKAIQTAQPIDASLEELYQAVEALCSHGMGEEVYSHLKVNTF